MEKIDLRPKRLNIDKVMLVLRVKDQWQMVVKDKFKDNFNPNLAHNFHQDWMLSNSSNTTNRNKISNNKITWCKTKVSNNSSTQECNNQWLEIFNHRGNVEILWLRFWTTKIKTQWWEVKLRWLMVCKVSNWMHSKERNCEKWYSEWNSNLKVKASIIL